MLKIILVDQHQELPDLIGLGLPSSWLQVQCDVRLSSVTIPTMTPLRSTKLETEQLGGATQVAKPNILRIRSNLTQ